LRFTLDTTCRQTYKDSFLLGGKRTYTSMINGTISVAVELKSGTENRGIYTHTHTHTHIYIYIYVYGILELISTRAMAGVTDDCQNSTISHAVMPSPFKSTYSCTARSSAAPVRLVPFRTTSPQPRIVSLPWVFIALNREQVNNSHFLFLMRFLVAHSVSSG